MKYAPFEAAGSSPPGVLGMKPFLPFVLSLLFGGPRLGVLCACGGTKYALLGGEGFAGGLGTGRPGCASLGGGFVAHDFPGVVFDELLVG